MLTKTERRVIEEMLRKAKHGPSMPFVHDPDEAERNARIWSETWFGEPLQALLDHDDGKISNYELRTWER